MPNKRVVVLTGAGISAESGLATFRDSGGLWEGYDVNEVASIEGWNNDPEKVLGFYNLRRTQAALAKPNIAHLALAGLEEYFEVEIITQNIDDLHERAGSTRVTHLHGKLSEARSEWDENLVVDIGTAPIKLGDKASDGSQLRPAIVWFGEMVPMIEIAAKIVSEADFFIVIGTSLAVYPAAGLVHYCKSTAGKYIIDPSTPALMSYEGWTFMQSTACEGVPKVIKQIVQENK
ncbi:MAG: NAD-dependent deacylase [Balneolales bacterium]|nr:NAD-dependent deacylase [Balneolales bacterium]